MNYVGNLLQYKVPIVLISATLPVSLLRLVENEFLFSEGVNRVIRSDTIRENIEYQVINIDRKLVEIQDIEDVLHTFTARGLGPTNKAIIFVSSTSTSKILSKNMNLPFYHAKEP